VCNPKGYVLKYENALQHLNISDSECKAMCEHKTENWILLPTSIYGAAVCLLIVNLESIREEKKEKEDPEYQPESNDGDSTLSRGSQTSLYFKFLVIFLEIIITFMVQGILIYKVYVETPKPDDDISGFCVVDRSLQIGAIAALTLWAVSTFGDIWTEGPPPHTFLVLLPPSIFL
jgi:hypothetical protein